MKRRIFWFWLAPPLLLSGAMFWLHSWGARDHLSNYSDGGIEAIVILGASVNSRGQASPILRARARCAFELWEQGRAPKIVCTGGVGTYAPEESVVAAQLLENWGVPRSAILLDKTSTSTRENALETAKLLPRSSGVIVVSEPFHLWRASRDFERAGLRPIPVAETLGWQQLGPEKKLFYLFREAILVGRDLVLR